MRVRDFAPQTLRPSLTGFRSGGKANGLCDLFNRCRSETANKLGGLQRKDAKAKKPSGKGGYDPKQTKLSCVPLSRLLTERRRR